MQLFVYHFPLFRSKLYVSLKSVLHRKRLQTTGNICSWTGKTCGDSRLRKVESAITGYPVHRENRENGNIKYIRENTGNLEILPKHMENRQCGLLKL